MSTLTGSNIKDTYKMLLKTATASGFNIKGKVDCDPTGSVDIPPDISNVFG